MIGATSAHFSARELRCNHCLVNGCHQAIVDALEAFRVLAGQPVTIASGYRCAYHNREVGGAPGSQHVMGMAADIRVAGMSPAQLEAIARRIPAIHGIGRADHQGYLHIDVREHPAQWCYGLDGKQRVYYPPISAVA